MNRISTHILDTSIGFPAKNVVVELSMINGGKSTILSEQRTNDDGRVDNFIEDKTIETGIYELKFKVDAYFDQKNTTSFYPSITIQFRFVKGEHYHVPLLLNPFGYSTYRGS